MSRKTRVAVYVGKYGQYEIYQYDTMFLREYHIYKNGERWETAGKHMDTVVKRILKYDPTAKPV